MDNQNFLITRVRPKLLRAVRLLVLFCLLITFPSLKPKSALRRKITTIILCVCCVPFSQDLLLSVEPTLTAYPAGPEKHSFSPSGNFTILSRNSSMISDISTSDSSNSHTCRFNSTAISTNRFNTLILILNLLKLELP